MYNHMNAIREKLAALEHDQWVEWSKNLAEKETLSQERLDRWKTMWCPYSELTEAQKDQNRVWADKVLSIFLGTCKENEYWAHAERMSKEVKNWPAWKLYVAKLKP